MRPVLICVIALCVTGCSAYDRPEIEVVGARVTQESPEGVVIDFTLDATNPNEVDLPLERVRYALSLDGRRVFEGTRSAEATVRRLGTQQLTLPVAIDLSRFAAPTGDTTYELTGSVVYVTPGEIAQLLFDAEVRRPRATFRQRGTLDFGEAATLEPEEPAAAE